MEGMLVDIRGKEGRIIVVCIYCRSRGMWRI